MTFSFHKNVSLYLMKKIQPRGETIRRIFTLEFNLKKS